MAEKKQNVAANPTAAAKAPAVEKSAKSAKTVTVCSKLKRRLQLFQMHDEVEIGPNGQSRIAQVARPVGDPVEVNGGAIPVGAQPKYMILGGYGLTPNVDAEFFEAWMEQNKHSMEVKNKLIFAAPTRDAAEHMAEDMAAVRSGLEPLDPTFTTKANGQIVPNDPRYPRSMNANLSPIHQADRNAVAAE